MPSYLNLSMINELREIMEEDFTVLFEAFLDDSQLKLEQLTVAMPINDYDSIRRLAHSLKGSCRNVGADKLADICELLENEAREHNFTKDEHFLSDLQSCFNSTRHEIQKDLLS